jgi:hypothetical protein
MAVTQLLNNINNNGIQENPISQIVPKSYVYIGYADNSSGLNTTEIFDESKQYIAIVTTSIPVAPSNRDADFYAGYWRSIVGKFPYFQSTRDNLIVLTDNNGNDPDYSTAFTNVALYLNGTDVTSDWTISLTTQSNLTATYNAGLLTITALNAETGYAVLTATRVGYDNVVKRFYTYKLRSNENQISVIKNDNIIIPSDSDGSDLPTSYDNAYTDIQVFDGPDNITSTWTLSKVSDNSLVSVVNNTLKRVTITSVTGATGYVTVRLSKVGYDGVDFNIYVKRINRSLAVIDVSSVDDVTIGVNGSDKIYVKDGGIDTLQLANGAVETTKLESSIQTTLGQVAGKLTASNNLSDLTDNSIALDNLDAYVVELAARLVSSGGGRTDTITAAGNYTITNGHGRSVIDVNVDLTNPGDSININLPTVHAEQWDPGAPHNDYIGKIFVIKFDVTHTQTGTITIKDDEVGTNTLFSYALDSNHPLQGIIIARARIQYDIPLLYTWDIIDTNIRRATSNIAGIIELATSLEVLTGEDSFRAVTPSTLASTKRGFNLNVSDSVPFSKTIDNAYSSVIVESSVTGSDYSYIDVPEANLTNKGNLIIFKIISYSNDTGWSLRIRELVTTTLIKEVLSGSLNHIVIIQSTGSDWIVVTDIGRATQSLQGTVELSSNAETIAGSLTSVSVTPSSLNARIPLVQKIINIGDWDMDATLNITVAHGLTLANIRSIDVMVRNDDDSEHYPLQFPNNTDILPSGAFKATSTDISLYRFDGKTFDNTSFDSTSYNRGWITIWYTV